MLCLRSSSISTAQRCLALRASSTKASSEIPKVKQDEVEGYKPAYATKANYDKSKNDHRFQSSNAEDGVRPTKWQRKFLVWTKLYKDSSSIPEYVGNGTMNRMHDRLRVLFIIVGTLGFFSTFFIVESFNARRIARDRASGKVVTKM